jgi:hypothetical protein
MQGYRYIPPTSPELAMAGRHDSPLLYRTFVSCVHIRICLISIWCPESAGQNRQGVAKSMIFLNKLNDFVPSIPDLIFPSEDKSICNCAEIQPNNFIDKMLYKLLKRNKLCRRVEISSN